MNIVDLKNNNYYELVKLVRESKIALEEVKSEMDTKEYISFLNDVENLNIER